MFSETFLLEFLNRERFSVGISQPETFFGWNFSTGNVFRLEFLNRKRFSVGISQPGTFFQLEFLNRERIFGWNFSTGDIFRLEFLTVILKIPGPPSSFSLRRHTQSYAVKIGRASCRE